jgi:hypothetical protein
VEHEDRITTTTVEVEVGQKLLELLADSCLVVAGQALMLLACPIDFLSPQPAEEEAAVGVAQEEEVTGIDAQLPVAAERVLDTAAVHVCGVAGVVLRGPLCACVR